MGKRQNLVHPKYKCLAWSSTNKKILSVAIPSMNRHEKIEYEPVLFFSAITVYMLKGPFFMHMYISKLVCFVSIHRHRHMHYNYDQSKQWIEASKNHQ